MISVIRDIVSAFVLQAGHSENGFWAGAESVATESLAAAEASQIGLKSIAG